MRKVVKGRHIHLYYPLGEQEREHSETSFKAISVAPKPPLTEGAGREAGGAQGTPGSENISNSDLNEVFA